MSNNVEDNVEEDGGGRERAGDGPERAGRGGDGIVDVTWLFRAKEAG